MSVDQLIGDHLDCAVAHVIGETVIVTTSGVRRVRGGSVFDKFQPSSDFRRATTLPGWHEVSFDVTAPYPLWAARVGSFKATGPTLLIAACRAMVGARR